MCACDESATQADGQKRVEEKSRPLPLNECRFGSAGCNGYRWLEICLEESPADILAGQFLPLGDARFVNVFLRPFFNETPSDERENMARSLVAAPSRMSLSC